MSRAQALADLDAEFARLLDAVEGLSEDRLRAVWYGDWSLRDILAHIAGWHREMAPGLERIARGERATPEGVDYDAEDEWNARFVASIGDAPTGAIMEELRASKDAFAAAALMVPEDRWEPGRTASRLVETTGPGHYREHLDAIEQWLGAQKA